MIDTTKIYSTEMFLEACLKDQMMLPDIYDFVENKTGYDYNKMLRLKHSFYQYKLKIVGKKLPEIQDSEKYKLMEENGESIPMMTGVSQFSKQEVIEDRNKTTQVVWDELKDFINEFLFDYFIHLDQAEGIFDYIMMQESIKSRPVEENSGIEFTGSELEFAELIKSLIEAKKLKGKSQKFIYEKLASFLNLKDLNKKQKIDSLGDRNKDITPFLFDLVEALENWNLKRKKS